MIDGPWKLLWNDAGRTRLHDLRRPDAEDVTLAPREPERVRQVVHLEGLPR